MQLLQRKRTGRVLAVGNSPKADYSSFGKCRGTDYNQRMAEYKSLRIESTGAVTTCLLNRPDRRNALNPQMIAELTEFFTSELPLKQPRIVVLRGAGGFFCAGADLNWMKESAAYSAEQNRQDALALFDVFAAINAAPCLTLACVEGGAYGGGIGLIACCDMALATADSRFSLSEVRLGLSPATISPFVSARIGTGHARHLMLSAMPFDADHGRLIGLLHEVCALPDVDGRLQALLGAALLCAPSAVQQTKQLLSALEAAQLPAWRERTADLIAALRTGPEGQEGLGAFLEKRQPDWATGE